MSTETVTSWRIKDKKTGQWFEGWASGDERTEGDWTEHRAAAEIFYDWPTVQKTAATLRRHRMGRPGSAGRRRVRVVIMRTVTRRKG